MKIPIKKIEEVTGYKVRTCFNSLGLDIAERTGFCKIITTDKDAIIDVWFVEFDKTNINKVYENMYETFYDYINNQNIVVIEDSFLQRFGKFVQADVFKKLTRFGTLALAVCIQKRIHNQFILAKSSRAKMKIKMITGKPKESVANWLKEKLDVDLKGDDDASDAIVLALLGLLEGMDYRSNADILKAKKKEKIKKEKDLVKAEKKRIREETKKRKKKS